MPRATKPKAEEAPMEPAAEATTSETTETEEVRDSGPVEERTAEAPADEAGEDPGVAPADVPQGIVDETGQPDEDPLPVVSVTPVNECPHGVDGGCPLCELDGDTTPASADDEEPEPEPEPLGPSLPDLLSDEEWDDLADEFGDADLPLDEGEEIMAQRTYDDGDLIVVTSFGRKLGISPDGWISVLTGLPLEIEAKADPKPPRKSWKDPR